MMFKSKFTMQTFQSTSVLDGGNVEYLEQLYETFLRDPSQVPEEWQALFRTLAAQEAGAVPLHSEVRSEFADLARKPKVLNLAPVGVDKQDKVVEWIQAHRLIGHLVAKVNPLNGPLQAEVPELLLKTYGLQPSDRDETFSVNHFKGGKRLPLSAIEAILKSSYCGTVASEFMHISDSEERNWVAERVESLPEMDVPLNVKKQLLDTLLRAEGLEKYLGAKYPGAKRFSLEGNDSLMIMLEQTIQRAGAQGAREAVIGMAHRGRLNVLVNLLGKNPSQLFDIFEGKYAEDTKSGDVKYHEGFSSDVTTPGGTMHIALAFNPSHLEIVCPVVCGSVKARQDRRLEVGQREVLPILLHGDAAFAGQGVVMETLNMSQTRGYGIGGTVHIIVNNQIGFTTSDPKDARSTLYCSDLGKMIQAPIFHVNGDDPEAVYRVTCLAIDYRNRFHKDVVIDLIGYRRHGHNEADEPAATQPTMYEKIRSMPTVSKIFGDYLVEKGHVTVDEIERLKTDYRTLLDSRKTIVARNVTAQTEQGYALKWKPFLERRSEDMQKVETGVPSKTLLMLAQHLCTLPEGWVSHPRVAKLLADRQAMMEGKLPIDWGYAENLAYASLLHDQYSIRISGQDCGRGTFFHRHAVLHHLKTGTKYVPLAQFAKLPARFTIFDSLLSEAAVMGFEYGYACTDPDIMVIWEAQFGDFANGAQVVIDQFISSGEQKWGRLCGLTLLLPHGYEGQGPEHSSARLERYLQLCAQHNMRVCVPTTPAQVFHMFRRQMCQSTRVPLIVMSPKSLLRHKLAISTWDELTHGSFELLLPDVTVKEASKVQRVVLCTGKIYYDVVEACSEEMRQTIAILRVEQLYPFPEEALRAELQRYKNAKVVVWCQEEPCNQGAWYSIKHHLDACVSAKQTLEYAGREAAAAPAVGSHVLHEKQQHAVIHAAIGKKDV